MSAKIKTYYRDNPVHESARRLHEKIFKSGKQNILLLFSGGSAVDILSVLEPVNNIRVTVSVLDERCDVSPVNNNFDILKNTKFFKKMMELESTSFIDTSFTKGDDCFEKGEELRDALKRWRDGNSDGKVIITQGIGEDGHTAGIMPYPEDGGAFNDLFEKDDFAVAYDAGDRSEFSKRFTVTLPFLREEVDYSLVFAVGKAKRGALRKALSLGKLNEAPARVIQEMKEVDIITNIKNIQ